MEISFLLDLYKQALTAADPLRVVPRHLPSPPKGRTIVVGLGKAAAAMARAVEDRWPGPLTGVVVVPRGATLPLKRIRQMESSHPIPDESSIAAGQALLAAVAGLTPDDLVIALVSGGGSALCAVPARGVTLKEKQEITRVLLLRGATIHEMNIVRRHLSALKGGKVAAAAHPARVVSLLISDIPGDDPEVIASGPTLPDSSTCGEALQILDRYGVNVSTQLRDTLLQGLLETPKPGDPRFADHQHRIIASAQTGLEAAAELAERRGMAVYILSNAMEGESRDLAAAHAAIAQQVQRFGQPFAAPCVLLSGGEATVTVAGQGRGGRNTEFALALALALNGRRGIHALSAGTDGLDGSGPGAGAWIDPATLDRARSAGFDPFEALNNNDTGSLFDCISATVVTGPTYTNINDFRAVLIERTP